VAKTQNDGSIPSLSPTALVNDDDNCPDFTKAQLFFWTVVAAVLYIVQAHTNMANHIAAGSLPDIDAALIVLMGMGHGTYLGGKLMSVDAPRLYALNPTAGKPGTSVTVTGTDLGTQGTLLIDGIAYWGTPTPTWADDKITFTVPLKQSDDRSDWVAGQPIEISVKTATQPAANPLKFTVQQ
jgi:hypothetical protein